MSRFVEEKENLTIAYGYDRPLQEYFFQVFDKNTDDGEESCILDKSSRHIKRENVITNGQMLELMDEYDVGTEEHKRRIALDLEI